MDAAELLEMIVKSGFGTVERYDEIYEQVYDEALHVKRGNVVKPMNFIHGGWRKIDRAVDRIAAVKAGRVDVIISTGKTYRAVKSIGGRSLKKGQIVFVLHKGGTVGVNEILGFTGHEEQYGDGSVEYETVKEVMRARGVKSLKDLQELQGEPSYGHSNYLVVKDLDSGKSGPWCYLHEARWAMGTGAVKLSFILMEEVEPAELGEAEVATIKVEALRVFQEEVRWTALSALREKVDALKFTDLLTLLETL